MTYWTRTRPRAKKQHGCVLCFRQIEPGETYVRGVGIDPGHVWSWKECLHCEAVLKLYDIQWDDTYSYHDFVEWTSGASNDMAELRAQAGYVMKWRTRYGTLLPVPTKEAA